MEEEVQIRHFKLINGDQIIAAVNSKNKDNWFLGTPVQVSNALLGGFSFSPWFPFSKEDNYKVKFHNVVQSTQADNDIKEAYIKFVLSLATFLVFQCKQLCRSKNVSNLFISQFLSQPNSFDCFGTIGN